MKRYSIISLIGLSALAIMLLIYFQLKWIQADHQLRSDLFSQRVNMALCQAVGNLAANDTSSGHIRNCIEVQHEGIFFPQASCKQPGHDQLEAALKIAFEQYNLPSPDSYRIFQDEQSSSPNSKCVSAFTPFSFFDQAPLSCSLAPISQNQSWRLEVSYPYKADTLWKNMKDMLWASLSIIAFISICLIFTIRMAWKQQQISKRNRDFIDHLAHEFKTPLANILLAGKLLQKQQKQDVPANRFLEVIQSEGLHLSERIEGVMQMLSLDEPRAPAHTSFQLKALLRSACDSIRLKVESRGGMISFHYRASSEYFTGSAGIIRQAIINLLDNAQKYSPNSPRIELSVRDYQEGICISCEDAGLGIPQDKQAHIFEKYYRIHTDEAFHIKGFGLGLAFVKKAAEAHHGYVKLWSKVGTGSRFELYLPHVS